MERKGRRGIIKDIPNVVADTQTGDGESEGDKGPDPIQLGLYLLLLCVWV